MNLTEGSLVHSLLLTRRMERAPKHGLALRHSEREAKATRATPRYLIQVPR